MLTDKLSVYVFYCQSTHKVSVSVFVQSKKRWHVPFLIFRNTLDKDQRYALVRKCFIYLISTPRLMTERQGWREIEKGDIKVRRREKEQNGKQCTVKYLRAIIGWGLGGNQRQLGMRLTGWIFTPRCRLPALGAGRKSSSSLAQGPQPGG